MNAIVATFCAQLVNNNSCHRKGQVITGVGNTTHQSKLQSQVSCIGNAFGKDPRDNQASRQHYHARSLATMLGFKKGRNVLSIGRQYEEYQTARYN